MKTKTFHIVVLLILTINLVIPTRAAHALTTWYVQSASDGNPTPANCPGVNCRLRDAIAAATSGDTIRFNLPTASIITLTYSQLFIDKNITIQSAVANNITISGNNAFRIVYVDTNVNATITGLTLANGMVSGNYGGALYIADGAVVSLSNLTITQNSVVPAGSYEDIGGGAIFNRGSLTITNSQISGNSTPASGVIYTYAGTILQMTNVILSGNHQQDGPNASAMISDKSALMTVISSQALPTTVSLDTVTVMNNTADTGAGAINSSGSHANIMISNSEFSGNTASVSTVLVGSNTTLNISGVIFSGNQALYDDLSGEGYGGALYVAGSSSQVTIVNSSFQNNVASREGGAIFAESSNEITLTGVTMSANQAQSNNGGAISAALSNVSITSSTINNNTSGLNGGGIFGNALAISNSFITGNSAAGHGGGIYLHQGGVVTSPSFTAVSIANNQAQLEGGGIYLAASNNLTGANLTISGNSAGTTNSHYGGGIKSNFGSTLDLTRVTISANSATGGGGGIAALGTNSLTNVTITGNSVTDPIAWGGGFYAGSNSTLNQVTVAGNSSGNQAGGVFVASGEYFSLQNSILADNTSVQGNPDCFGNIASQGFNLIETITPNCFVNGTITGNLTGQDPLLSALSNHGGPTQTLLPASGSPAIDAADNTSCESEDQRGILRPEDGDDDGTATCDMGAVEVEGGLAVQSVTRASSNPTSATSADFAVTFTEAVNGVDPTDFTLTKTGAISGEGISSISGAGEFYIVTVNTGSGNGTLRLDVVDDDTILDLNNDPLGGAGLGNGSFAAGEVYIVTKTSPLLLSPEAGEQLLNNRPVFDWSDFPSATSYQLMVSPNNAFSTLLLNKTLSSSGYNTTTDLPANKTLYWRVRAKVGLNYSSWSGTQSFMTAKPPSIPALKSPANNMLLSNYTPLLDWSNATVPDGTSFDRYQVQVAANAAFTSIVIDETTSVGVIGQSSHTPAMPLDPNGKYYWRVRAFNSAGQYSNWSAVWTLRARMSAPILVTPNHNTDVLTPRPTFDWSGIPGGSITGYTIQISRNNSFTQVIHTGKPIASGYVPAVDLPKNLPLYWRVQGKGANGPSAWSEVRTFNSANSPSTPGLSAPALNALLSDDTPLLKWSVVTLPAGTSFQHYQVQVDDDADFSSPVSNNTSITNRLLTVLPLPEVLIHNAKYYWRVRAVNTDNETSNWSAVRYFRIKVDVPILLAPANGAPAGTLQPVLDWEDVAGPGAVTYNIQISLNANFSTLLLNSNSPLSTYKPMNNLPSGKTLYWRVSAKGSNGPSAWSVVFSFTTP